MRFYEVFESLCDAKGVSPRRAGTDIGLGNSAASTWKARNSAPKSANMKKIAAYFGVTLESLMNYENIQSITELKKELPDVRIIPKTDNYVNAISGVADRLPIIEQERLYKYIQFTYPEFFR